MELPCDPAIPILGMYPNRLKTETQTDKGLSAVLPIFKYILINYVFPTKMTHLTDVFNFIGIEDIIF